MTLCISLAVLYRKYAESCTNHSTAHGQHDPVGVRVELRPIVVPRRGAVQRPTRLLHEQHSFWGLSSAPAARADLASHMRWAPVRRTGGRGQ
jgi:hypothetical protein